MAIEITLPNVQLSPDQVRARLQSRLAAGDRIVGKKALFIDFTIRRTGAVGVGVKVKPAPGGTLVKLYGFPPSFMLRMIKGFVLAIFLSRKWARMEAEVAGWLTAPAQTRPAAPTQARPGTNPPPRPPAGQVMAGQRRP